MPGGALRTGGTLGAVMVPGMFTVVWGVAVAGLVQYGLDEWLALAALCLVPLGLAVLPALAQRAVALPLLLPGSMLFFKQNDALVKGLGPVSVNDLLALAVAGMLVFQLRRKDATETLNGAALILLLLAGLTLLLMVSGVNAIIPALVTETVATYGEDIIFALLVALCIRSARDLSVMLNWLMAATSFTAAVMVLDGLRGKTLFPAYDLASWRGVLRSAGASTEAVPNVAAVVLVGTLVAANMAARGTRGHWIYTAVAVLGAAAIVSSISRGPLVALGLGGLLLLFRLRKHEVFRRAVGVVATGLVIGAMFMPQAVISKFVAVIVPSEDRTVERRLSYQEIGVDLFLSAPIIGIGAGNYATRYASDDYRFVSGRGTEPRPLHNLYLQYGTEAGIMAMVMFGALIVVIAATFLRGTRCSDLRLRTLSEGLLAAYCALAFQLFFLSSKSFLGFWLMVGLAIAVARLTLDRRDMSGPHGSRYRA